MWPVYVFNLVAALLIAGWYLCSVRRLEHRMDERLRRFNEWADAEEVKYGIVRDEIRASMRARVDAMVAQMEGTHRSQAIGRGVESQALDALVFTHVIGNDLIHIPTKGEIYSLPRWARVAFAARCARRVLPLVKHLGLSAPLRHLRVLDRAVSVAEEAAAAAAAAAEDNDYYAAATTASGDAAAIAVYAAYAAAVGAAVSDADATPDVAVAAAAVAAASVAPSAAAADGATDARGEVRRDFNLIRGLTLANGWNDGSGVNPSVFGPLWSAGGPKGWPMPEAPATELVFEFDVPGDMSTTDAIAFAKELSVVLCELDFAGGGHGLAIQPPLEITVPARVGVPAG